MRKRALALLNASNYQNINQYCINFEMTPNKQRKKTPISLEGSLPLYVEITEQIARQIAAGHLVDGQKLPPEREMASGYGISVGTLRKALARLIEMGLVKSIQGSGNYIQKTENAASLYSFFRLELPSGGGLPRAHLLSYHFCKKPDDLPAFGKNDFAHSFRRLRFLDDEAIALEEIWLDGSVGKIKDRSLISESLYQFFKDEFGIWITKAEDWVGLSEVPDWAEPPFSLTQGSLAGFIERFGTSQTDEIVEYSRTWFDNHKARYVSRLK